MRPVLWFALLSFVLPVQAGAQVLPVLTATWGDSGLSVGQFNAPYHIALNAQGQLFVTDSENDRIQKFDNAGNYIMSWGHLGSGPGEFNIPSGITIDKQGNVYVGDSDNHVVQKFDANGRFLASSTASGPPAARSTSCSPRTTSRSTRPASCSCWTGDGRGS